MTLPSAPVALAGLAAAGATFALAWLVSFARRDASVADIFWGPGFVALAWAERAAAGAAGPRALAVLACVTLWGARLALHLAARARGRGEDARYAEMRARSPRTFAWTSLVTVFALQAALLVVIATPVHAAFAAPRAELGPAAWAGLALWAAGFAIEAIADAQLARFRAAAAPRGRVLDRGLWAWSRHPNYFGEAVQWWALALVAWPGPGGAWVLAGPVLVTFLLLRVSGVTLLERHLRERRPAYAAYAARTSAFVPWPPRRGAGRAESPRMP